MKYLFPFCIILLVGCTQNTPNKYSETQCRELSSYIDSMYVKIYLKEQKGDIDCGMSEKYHELKLDYIQNCNK